MKSSILSIIASLAFYVNAIPTPQPLEARQANCNVSQGQFYLITTASPMCNSNSSNIPMASATSLFAPEEQPNFLLRTIGPGYLSLPVFTYSEGSLHTWSSNAFGQGNYTYGSLSPSGNTELQFLQDEQVNAGLNFKGGFLLGVNGVTDQWKLCDGPLGETVVCLQYFT